MKHKTRTQMIGCETMKQIIIGLALAALVGCVPGEATIKISAENVRRVLSGEVVEVPVHGEVKMAVSIEEWKKELKCPMCQRQGWNLTNAVAEVDRRACAATTVLTLLLADGSCVTGGVKVVDTNVVYWARVDTKFLFGTEEAMLAASNRVNQCNGFFVLNDKGEFDLELGKCEDLKSQKLERIFDVLGGVAKGCKCCDVYGDLPSVLVAGAYDSITVVLEGDGQGGFCVETGDKRVAADQIGKELRCVVHSKDSGNSKLKLKRE